MNYAIIENGKVINIALSDAPLADNWVASDIAKIGDEYINGEFFPAVPDLFAKSNSIRLQRNIILSGSDWLVTKAFETGAPINQAWAIYRQALRDIPQQSGFPENVIWPTPPE